MPRVRGFTNEQKLEHQQDVLIDNLESLLLKNKISKSAIARYLNLSPQAVCSQFERKSISMGVLIAIVTLANPEADRVKSMFTVKG